MPLTTIYADGTRVIGDATALEQTLHPTVMNYINIMRSNGSYSMSVNEIDAINNMVQSLVSNGLWTKIKALYPVLGGTAATHKFNLKDPRDADAAFRLVFNGGGWTHSSSGMTPNGTTSWANTFFNLSTNLSVTSGHLSFYSPVELNGAGIDMGASQNSNSNPIGSLTVRTTNISDFMWGIDPNAATTNRARTTTLSSLGFFVGNQNGNTASNRTIWVNGAFGASATVYGATTLPNVNVAIGALNNSPAGVGIFSARRCSFASIGDGLTNAEIKQFSTIVQTYQTKLGRQV